jgi:acyl CoA:acetate/3-ketoacid CoA transferase alpha subunit/acyl CoA:acetate/3-ketoacid CoA transferase beta subunit
MPMEGKVTTLHELIARYLMPGARLHLAGGIGGPAAAVCELLRQFRGKRPGFELVQSTVTGHSINLLHAGLVRKVSFAAGADISTSGRPSRVMQEAWAKQDIELENWSLSTLQQRLLAGAMGVGFLPTRSLAGSTLAEADAADFRETADPFTGEPAGVVRALNPDVSIVHGVCADENGNTILQVPWGEDIWGPLAAATVLVTVEKIVPAAVIHAGAALVKLPGHAVTAVAEAPFGLHPFALAPPAGTGIQGYETDTAFLVDLHNAFADDARLDAWLEEWVYGCEGHEAYLNKLGNERLESLRYRPAAEVTPEPATPPGGPATPAETVLVAAAREIERCVTAGGHGTILAGAGNRAAAVLLAYYNLKEKGYRLDIVTGNGQVGYEPRGGALGTQGIGGVYESTMLTDTLTSLGVLVGGARNRCLSVLGAGQIDKYGNTNSTLAADGRFLVGSGGANDAANAGEVLVVVNQSRERFPARLPYITCPGTNVTTVVTDRGVFRKNAAGELELAACLPDAELPALADRVRRIRESCGWEFATAANIENTAPPSAEELAKLRTLVPGK